MKGFLMVYKPKSDYARTIFNHLLFGRIIYRSARGKKYSYYVPGMLDKTPYVRIMSSRIFVKHIDYIDMPYLQDYAIVDISECEREFKEEHMKTGEEFWHIKSEEKGLPMKRARRHK